MLDLFQTSWIFGDRQHFSSPLPTGKSYWVFDGERQITGPDSVYHLGLHVTDIQAALMWGEEKAQKIYFFKDGNYWRFNPEENRVDSPHPRNMHDWRGVPTHIDAAFQDRYGERVVYELLGQQKPV